MRSSLFAGALALVIGLMPPPATADVFQISSEIAAEINVTSDSSSGWTPAAEQQNHALATVENYLDALDGGSYAKAYGLYAADMKGAQTLAQFTQDEMKFEAMAGAVRFWRVLKVTWTKDPAQAPYPGIYVAVDLASQFANVDRYCGYIVLYQPSAGDEFTIMRIEKNYMDNATARQAEQKQSKASVDEAWRKLSQNCPNYVPQP